MKKILITGVSRGLGRHIAKTIHEAGYEVTGTCRDPEKVQAPFRVLPLNLQDSESIENLVRQAGHVDILINNAAQSQLGASEDTPIHKWREIFQTNFFGVVQLNQHISKQMRDRGNGRIINIGSLSDRIPVPFQSSYAATKCALRGYSLCLWNELRPFGIKVSIVELFNVRTEDLLNREVHTGNGSPYSAPFNNYLIARRKGYNSADDPVKIAKDILSIVRSNSPRPIYIPGAKGKIISLMQKFLPDETTLRLIASRTQRTT